VKKILFAVMAAVLSLAMMGGAFAYFTDVETSKNNTIQAGTLDMQIADNNEGWFDSPSFVSASIVAPALIPGQSFTSDPIRFQNKGTIPIRYIYGRFDLLEGLEGTLGDMETLGVNNIYDYIVLTSYWEQAQGTTGFYEETFDTNNANAYLQFWGLAQDGSISLQDLILGNAAGDSAKTGLWFFDGGNDPTNPPLPVGGIAQLKFTFKLLETTPNDYQGDIAKFGIDFVGVQDGIPGTGGFFDTAITEGVGNIWGP